MPRCIRIFHLIRPDPFQLRRDVTVQKCLWDQHGLEVLVIKEIRSASAAGGKSKAKYVIKPAHTSIVFNELFQDNKPWNGILTSKWTRALTIKICQEKEGGIVRVSPSSFIKQRDG